MDLKRTKARLTGVIGFPITPFVRELDGSAGPVDEEGVRERARALLESGIKAMVPCGGTGEFYSLTLDEWKSVVRAAIEEVGKEALVIAGIGHATNIAVSMAKYAEGVGYEAVMVSPPPFGASEQGLFEHYSRVAASVDVGIVLFRTPSAPVSEDLIIRLSRIPNVIAIKDEHGDLEWFRGVMEAAGDRLVGICGISEMMAPYYFVLGAKAYTTGLCNIVPQMSLKMYEAIVDKDVAAIRDIQRRLGPISRLRGSTFNHVSVIKESLEMMGCRAGPPRLPLRPLSEPDRRELVRLLANLKVALKV
jgi:4-hydroxy-tetrahydrodipicolinate synthase